MAALRILVIEDNDDVREILRELLRGEGYEILDASDGTSGLELVERNRVDLVLTDIVMPGQEGIEVIHTLRERWPEVRIVAISGTLTRSGFDYLRAARMMGADRTLQKPFRRAEVLRAVRELLSA